jgi:hypothetical protein
MAGRHGPQKFHSLIKLDDDETRRLEAYIIDSISHGAR